MNRAAGAGKALDPQVSSMRSPRAIRERCGQLFQKGESGELLHFKLHPEKFPEIAQYVREEILRNYPKLDIPYHSRWRHFDVGNHDRVPWLHLPTDPLARGEALFDLVIVSVLLDAGAGMPWTYQEKKTGLMFKRSEGLAVASFDMFAAGLFSSTKDQPLRVDGDGLLALTEEKLAQGFQVSSQNPILGLSGRLGLLKSLGRELKACPEFFGTEARLGRLFRYLVEQAPQRTLKANTVLQAVLASLGNIWPGREMLHGVNLGDCWRHPLVKGDGETNELVPFHKLSQWLTYSLLEPLEEYGLTIEGLDELTGLPEYRNGGLLLDLGLLTLKDPTAAKRLHKPGDPLIVEWRALTVISLDRIAEIVRKDLKLTAATFPLAKVLQGGTWTAGRRIAKEKRSDGGPPLQLDSDGTVF